jgi:hypothetical protein
MKTASATEIAIELARTLERREVLDELIEMIQSGKTAQELLNWAVALKLSK